MIFPDAQASQDLVCRTGAEMGTEFRICVYPDPKDRMNVEFDLQRSFQTLKDLNSWMSDWIPGTELNRINEAAGSTPVKISQELWNLLALSQKISEKSHGAYDPTFNVFFGLYNFKPGQEREPSDTEIKERLALINHKDLVLDRQSSTAFLKRKGMKLGLGAIGQGYGVDKVVSQLRARYPAGYVDGSGDTFFWGKKPNGELWSAGIRNPIHKESLVAKLYLTDRSVTTAGDDEKFFMVGERRVHHILDPKTGRPATKVRQVTVIGDIATTSDAWDTACFVMGTADCLKALEKENLEAVIFETTGRVVFSKGLQKKSHPKWGDYWTLSER